MIILGVDIGGTGVKGAPVDTEKGELIDERYRVLTPQPATPEAIAGCVKAVADHFAWHGLIGCGFPAVVQNGIMRTAANVDDGWIGTNGQALFTEATGCTVKVVNDADAAGLAEMRFGAGRGEDGVVLMITLGTGIGVSVFTNRQLLPNTELGHIEIRGKDAERRASEAAKKRKNLTWEQWAERLNVYFDHLERLLWPDLLIIGGGASKRFEEFGPLLQTRARLVKAEMQNEAGIIGAALAGLPPRPASL